MECSSRFLFVFPEVTSQAETFQNERIVSRGIQGSSFRFHGREVIMVALTTWQGKSSEERKNGKTGEQVFEDHKIVIILAKKKN